MKRSKNLSRQAAVALGAREFLKLGQFNASSESNIEVQYVALSKPVGFVFSWQFPIFSFWYKLWCFYYLDTKETGGVSHVIHADLLSLRPSDSKGRR